MYKVAYMKTACRVLADLLLVLLFIPFGFVFLYFFPLFFTGRNRLALLADIAELALSVSWVSCTFLFILGLCLRIMIRRGLRWYFLFAVSLLGGGVWLTLWNMIVEPTFSFRGSLFPLTVCCAMSTAYALGRFLYSSDSWNFSDHPLLDFHEDADDAIPPAL